MAQRDQNKPESEEIESLNADELDVDRLDDVAGGSGVTGRCDNNCGVLYSCENNW